MLLPGQKDNYETVTVNARVCSQRQRWQESKGSCRWQEGYSIGYFEKEIKKDKPSRLHARRQMLKVFYGVTSVPKGAAGKKEEHSGS